MLQLLARRSVSSRLSRNAIKTDIAEDKEFSLPEAKLDFSTLSKYMEESNVEMCMSNMPFKQKQMYSDDAMWNNYLEKAQKKLDKPKVFLQVANRKTLTELLRSSAWFDNTPRKDALLNELRNEVIDKSSLKSTHEKVKEIEEPSLPKALCKASQFISAYANMDFIFPSAASIVFLNDRVLGEFAVAIGLVEPSIKVIKRSFLEEQILFFKSQILEANQNGSLKMKDLSIDLDVMKKKRKGLKSHTWTLENDNDLMSSFDLVHSQLNRASLQMSTFLSVLDEKAKARIASIVAKDFVDSSKSLSFWSIVASNLNNYQAPSKCQKRWKELQFAQKQ